MMVDSTEPAGRGESELSGDIQVRVATDMDIPALFDIRTSVAENHMSLSELAAVGVTPESVRDMLRTTSRAWVALELGAPVGFSMANLDERTVFALFVRPGREGKGVGGALLRMAEEWLAEGGAEIAWLLTGADEALRAHRLYRAAGWRVTGVVPDGQLHYEKRLRS